MRGAEKETTRLKLFEANFLCYSADGTHIIGTAASPGSNDDFVFCLGTEEGRRSWCIRVKGAIFPITLSPDGAYFMAVSASEITVYSSATGKPAYVSRKKFPKTYSDLLLSNTGARYYLFADDVVSCVSVSGGSTAWSFHHTPELGSFGFLAGSPDDKALLSVDGSGLSLHNTATGVCVGERNFTGHADWFHPYYARFDGRGKTIVVAEHKGGGGDGGFASVRIFDARSLVELKRYDFVVAPRDYWLGASASANLSVVAVTTLPFLSGDHGKPATRLHLWYPRDGSVRLFEAGKIGGFPLLSPDGRQLFVHGEGLLALSRFVTDRFKFSRRFNDSLEFTVLRPSRMEPRRKDGPNEGVTARPEGPTR